MLSVGTAILAFCLSSSFTSATENMVYSPYDFSHYCEHPPHLNPHLCFFLTGCVVHIQSWWRMMKPYHAFLALKRAQKATKAVYYRALRLYWKSERLFRVSTALLLMCSVAGMFQHI